MNEHAFLVKLDSIISELATIAKAAKKIEENITGNQVSNPVIDEEQADQIPADGFGRDQDLNRKTNCDR